MTVRCKFHCNTVSHVEGSWYDSKVHDSSVTITHSAEFSVVTGKSAENEEFFKSTPNGTLKLTTLRSDLFVPGKDYYLDITPAE